MNVLAALTVGVTCVSYAGAQTAAKLSSSQIVDNSAAAPPVRSGSVLAGGFPGPCGFAGAESAQRIAEYPRPVNLATAAGGKVSRIVVNEWHQFGKYRTWSDIVTLIQRVWPVQLEEGRPQGAPGVIDGIPWAEAASPFLFATLEFEDSKVRGCLVTDGVHIGLRDVYGGLWIDRLRPENLPDGADADWRAGKLSAGQIVDGSTADRPMPSDQSWLRLTQYEVTVACGSPGMAGNRQQIPAYPRPVTVATAAGAKVSRIVVDEWHPYGQNRWSDIVASIQRVWSGRLETAEPDLFPHWAEGAHAFIIATLEFEGSKVRGCLATDGIHIGLRDVYGRVWIDRLRPESLRNGANVRVH
jgi:hypothetical protein